MSAFLAGVPTLVLGGDLDRLVMRPSTIRTALYHGAEHETFGRMGHFMQLDRGADRVAARILDWMEERGLA
jgi:pimeloyl-ACP methyl ester carboxylesterase